MSSWAGDADRRVNIGREKFLELKFMRKMEKIDATHSVAMATEFSCRKDRKSIFYSMTTVSGKQKSFSGCGN